MSKKKKIIEKLRKHSVLLLTVLLFLPAGIQLTHTFEEHKQTICSSDVIHHFHQQDIDCELCHLQVKTYAILAKEVYSFVQKNITFNIENNYQFLFIHQQLSYSLRGPPFFNFL